MRLPSAYSRCERSAASCTPGVSSASDEILASVQRQRARLFARDHLATLARISFDQRMRGSDIDSLRDLAHRQLDVNPEPPSHLELNVVDEPWSKPRLFRRDDVDPGFGGGKFVVAVSSGYFRRRDAGRRAGQRDLRVTDRGTGRIAHGADDGTGIELSTRRAWAEEEHTHNGEKVAHGWQHMEGL